MRLLIILYALVLLMSSARYVTPQATLINASTVQLSAAPASQTGEKKQSENKPDASALYQEMFNKLLDRALWVFGAVGGLILILGGIFIWLIKWTFGNSQKEVAETLKKKLEEMGITQMQKELNSVRDEYEKLRREIDSVTAYRSRRIKWFYAAGCTVPDRSRLEAVGLQRIEPVPVEKSTAINLADADLVIISHEGDQKELGADLYKRILNTFIQERLPTPLVAYTLNNYKLTTDEFAKLNQVELAVPANTHATLVGYVESLLRVGKVQKVV